jgi:hypothetical protein
VEHHSEAGVVSQDVNLRVFFVFSHRPILTVMPVDGKHVVTFFIGLCRFGSVPTTVTSAVRLPGLLMLLRVMKASLRR